MLLAAFALLACRPDPDRRRPDPAPDPTGDTASTGVAPTGATADTGATPPEPTGDTAAPPDTRPFVVTRTATATRGGGRFEVEVEVADGITHFQVTGVAAQFVSLEEVYDPLGERVLYWEDWWESPRSLTNAFFGFDRVTAFDWPSRAEDGPLAEGTWRTVWALTDAEGYYVGNEPVDVTTAVKRDPDPASGAVSVQIVWADGVDGDPAVVDAVARGVERWREVWAPYGLTLRERYVASTLDPLLGFAYRGDPEVARVAALRQPGELQLVVGEQVRRGYSTYGVAGGVPGTVESTDLTFVVLAWLACAGRDAAFDDDEIRLMGETMAHEVGHYLGLFHPVEGTHDAWDALSDTVDCTGPGECASALGRNLMFPYAICPRGTCLPTDELTPDQVAVAQGYAATL